MRCHTYTHTHTGGSVNRLLVVSDEQAISKCAAKMQKREKKMRRKYIGMKRIGKAITVVC